MAADYTTNSQLGRFRTRPRARVRRPALNDSKVKCRGRGTLGSRVAFIAALMLAPLLPSAAASGSTEPHDNIQIRQITGSVFADTDGDGTRDPGEDPIAEVTATAYDDAGVEVASGTTGDDGTVRLTVAGPVRVEWSGWPDELMPTALGANSGGSVQFATQDTATQDTVIGLGLTRPDVWCESHALAAVTCPKTLRSGEPPTAGDGAIVFDETTGRTRLSVPMDDIGATYGAAWHQPSGSVFLGAYTKRHAPLGPLGTGGIYRLDISTGTSSAVLDLGDLGIDTGEDPHPAPGDRCGPEEAVIGSQEATCWHYDAEAAHAVGRTGLGDLDVSADGNSLYIVDLANRQLITLPIKPDGTLDTAAISRSPAPTADCNDPTYAVPFALGTSDAGLFLGVTCTGPTAADLAVYVYVLDQYIAGNGTAEDENSSPTRELGPVFGNPVFGTRLDAARPASVVDTCSDCAADWRPWEDQPGELISHDVELDGQVVRRVTHPQPMLVDIDVSSGDLVLGLRDRSGDLIGRGMGGTDTADPATYDVATAGDVLRACDVDGASATLDWKLESLGGCGDRTSSGSAPEFHVDGPATGDQPELLGGSMTRQPGRSAITATTISADREHFLAVADLSDLDGEMSRVRNLELGDGVSPVSTSANDLGDVEFLCTLAPTEVGDRVWLDSDVDGVQDPGEPPLAGVTITATAKDGEIHTTTSDENGSFVLTLDAPHSYQIIVDPSTIADGVLPNGATPDDLTATVSNSTTDDIDSDLNVANDKFVIAAATDAPGVHLHNLDAGFALPDSGQIGGRLYFDRNRNQTADSTDLAAASISVDLLTADGAPVTDSPGDLVGAQLSGPDGGFLFDQLLPGAYVVDIEAPEGFGVAGFVPSPIVGRLRSPVIVIAATEPHQTIDGSLVVSGAAVHIEKYVNGVPANEPPTLVVTHLSSVVFTYEITNIGALRIEGLLVFDDRQIQVKCPTNVLAPGETMVCDGEDVARTGNYTNTGLVTGTAENGSLVAAEDTASYFGERAEVAITTYAQDQDANEPPGVAVTAGVPVHLSYIASNRGNVALDNVYVADTAGADVSCPTIRLTPGETMICFGRHDGAVGEFSTIGQVTATTDSGLLLSDADPAHWFGLDAGIDIIPTVGVPIVGDRVADAPPGPVVEAGSTLVFGYQVSNTGNEPLTDLMLLESGAEVTCPRAELAPGETISCQGAPFIVEQGAGTRSVTGTAKATPTTPGVTVGDAVTGYYTGVGSAFTTATENPQQADAGSTVLISHIVTNTGDTSLHSLNVLLDSATPVTCAMDTLEVGASTSCLGSLTVRPGTNPLTLTTSATSSTGEILSSVESISILGVQTSVRVEIEAPKHAEAGAAIVINHVVQNDGTVPLIDLVVVGPDETEFICTIIDLDPGTASVCVGSYVVTNGPNIIEITTTARSTTGAIIENTATVSLDGQEAAMTLSARVADRAVDGPVEIDPENPAALVYAITNTGVVTLSAVAVESPLGPIKCPTGDIAPEDTVLCDPIQLDNLDDPDLDSSIRTSVRAEAAAKTPAGATVVATLELEIVRLDIEPCGDPNELVDVTFSTLPGHPVSDLRRLRLKPGAELIMTWTGYRNRRAGCTISLAVYETASERFDPSTEQMLVTSITCGPDIGMTPCEDQPGIYRLQITLPTGLEHFQVDAILGEPLASVGPIGGFYDATGRLIDANNI